MRERVETRHKDACPSHGASERGQEDVWQLAGRVRRRACGRAKECCPVADRSASAPAHHIEGQPRRSQCRRRWQTACKRASLGRSHSIVRPVVAVCCAAVAEPQPLSASACRCSLTSCAERRGARLVRTSCATRIRSGSPQTAAASAKWKRSSRCVETCQRCTRHEQIGFRGIISWQGPGT